MIATAADAGGVFAGGLNDFWLVAQDVWARGALGSSVGRLLLAALVLMVSLILRGVVAHWVVGFFRRLTSRSSTALDDALVESLAGPAKVLPVLVGVFVAAEILQLPEDVRPVVDRFLISAVIFALFWALVRLVNPLFDLLTGLRAALTPAIVDWARSTLKGFFVFIGAATILQEWGIEIWPILASLGIFGVAVALGAQDFFKNLISGVLIITERRFRNGDWIKVDGVVEGTVEKMGFRSTQIRRFDKGPVYVPNSKLADNALTNFSRMTHRRIYWVIGIEYGASVEQLRTIRGAILDYVMTTDAFAKPPEVSTFVHVNELAESSIDFMLYCFTKTTNWGEWLEIKEALALRLKEIVEGAGAAFAFPSRTVYLAGADAPEVFSPPAAVAPKLASPAKPKRPRQT